jgi:endonuclease/exonuclease/phosphatase (EEP) superfamily protein YafD
MMKTLFRIALFAALVLSSCISVPDKHVTVNQRGDTIVVDNAGNCDTVRPEKILESGPAQKPELDSRGFEILTWNVLRGEKEGWKEDFEHLSEYKDILTVQEARLTDDLRELLDKDHYNWTISTAFTYNGAETGVLTASKFEPSFDCTFRINEPLINIPKTVQVTLYPLSNSDESLMVVNIHSINFTIGTEIFGRQLKKVEEILLQHPGPVIFSGDVNTWSRMRMEILENLAMRLGLEAVTFENQYRTRIFGNNIDHVYYRGLTVIDAEIIKVNSSDHNPMLVSFRLEEAG